MPKSEVAMLPGALSSYGNAYITLICTVVYNYLMYPYVYLILHVNN